MRKSKYYYDYTRNMSIEQIKEMESKNLLPNKCCVEKCNCEKKECKRFFHCTITIVVKFTLSLVTFK